MDNEGKLYSFVSFFYYIGYNKECLFWVGVKIVFVCSEFFF